MKKSIYEKPEAEVLFFNLDDVRMIGFQSSTHGQGTEVQPSQSTKMKNYDTGDLS